MTQSRPAGEVLLPVLLPLPLFNIPVWARLGPFFFLCLLLRAVLRGRGIA